jgi:hypothetical protein
LKIEKLPKDKFVYESIQEHSSNSAWDLFEDKLEVNSDNDLLEFEQIKVQSSLLAKTDIKILIPTLKVSYFGEFFIEYSENKQHLKSEFLPREVLIDH